MAVAVAAPKPANDYTIYEDLLRETRDGGGACHRDLAVASFTTMLLEDEERRREFAESHAARIADRFDKQRSAETAGHQLSFDEDTWWICGKSERVQTRDLRVAHWDGWYTIQRQQFVAQSAVFVAKSNDYDRYRPVMVALDCTLWSATAALRKRPDAG